MAIDLKHSLLATVLLLAAAASTAQSGVLNDPTRPANAYLTPTAEATVTAASRLTSVMIPEHGGRRSAVIDGQILRVGEKLGDAKLVNVNETSVVLSGPAGRETLYLIPDVNKTHAVRRSGSQRSAKEKR